MNTTAEIIDTNKCFHCGLECDSAIRIEDKVFCCTGCRTVYEILNENGLSEYYSFQSSPGIKQDISYSKYDYLELENIFEKLVDFSDDKLAAVTFYIPGIHCSSCIWLLENLFRLSPWINESKVNFLKKNVAIKFLYKQLSLKELVILLVSLGYEPVINIDKLDSQSSDDIKFKRIIHKRLGVAAFCFGNIMLLSFPEYLSVSPAENPYRNVFNYLNLLLSLPVFFYSATGYFISAFKGLRNKIINIDFPLSLGILILFLRSVFELLVLDRAGYFDSLAGLVFFLLLGKLFQSKTYEALNFERSYKAYFPLAVIKKEADREISIPAVDLVPGDRIIIRNDEIIPSDSLLIKGEGFIDYSFVTGESLPVTKKEGELLYAGGKQKGAAIELEAVKAVSQSYLTELWNNSSFIKPVDGNFTIFSNTISKYFTYVISAIAFTAAAVHLYTETGEAFNVLTAVLIVACPCALAMSVPFTFGNSLRILGRNKLYLKNIRTVEELAKTDTIVFDKTGTLTNTGTSGGHLIKDLSAFEKGLIKSLVRNSTHPLSRKIYDYFSSAPVYDVSDYIEEPNKGIQGYILGYEIKAGSYRFINGEDPGSEEGVYVSINGETKAVFYFDNIYRSGIKEMVAALRNKYDLYLLTGDGESEKERLLKMFPGNNKIKFRCTPGEKLDFIKQLRDNGRRVMMVGDGLNDAGALSISNTGIAVTENSSNFTPASDGILESGSLNKLSEFLIYSGISVKLIYVSYAVSLIYNIAGITFAVQGLLTPIIAAILMPLSSVSVVAFASLSTNIIAKRRGLLSQ